MSRATLERLTSETFNEQEVIYYLKTAGYQAHPIWRGGGRAYGLQTTIGDNTYQAYVELVDGKEKWKIIEVKKTPPGGGGCPPVTGPIHGYPDKR